MSYTKREQVIIEAFKQQLKQKDNELAELRLILALNEKYLKHKVKIITKKQ